MSQNEGPETAQTDASKPTAEMQSEEKTPIKPTEESGEKVNEKPREESAEKTTENHEEPPATSSSEETKPETEKTGGGKGEHPHGAAAKAAAAKEKVTKKHEKSKDSKTPAGGFDDTKINPAPDGFTVRFTFHQAVNLPVADFGAVSSDPFVHATLTSPGIKKRHKEDPDVILRTKTVHRSTSPVFEQSWVVAGVPGSGFRLKCRLYDEDPSDHDDRLGNVTVFVSHIGDGWRPIRRREYDIKKRMGSKRAYAVQGCIALLRRDVKYGGQLVMSIEVLGRSEPPYGRMYTVGPCVWMKHQSPMIGWLAGTKAPGENDGGGGGDAEANQEKKMEKYDFQANQFQLEGPVPAALYHRFVEFKPFVKGMFSKAGLRGRVLNKALHHQHARIYSFSPSTEYGSVEARSAAAALQFLHMVHFDEGGRIFTYVLTLDGLLRFTETGKEFGIDLLSKHTMHSDVNIYIACSGEFFVRRLGDPGRPADAPGQRTHPEAGDLPGGPPAAPPPREPQHYELVVDNDSGTYRPNGDLLPELQRFLSRNLPGIHVVTKRCMTDELDRMKQGQRERKKAEGRNIQVMQNSDDELSSSDEEAFERRQKRQQGKQRGGSGGGRKKGGGGEVKSSKQLMFDAVEDPKKAMREMGMAKEKQKDETGGTEKGKDTTEVTKGGEETGESAAAGAAQ